MPNLKKFDPFLNILGEALTKTKAHLIRKTGVGSVYEPPNNVGIRRKNWKISAAERLEELLSEKEINKVLEKAFGSDYHGTLRSDIRSRNLGDHVTKREQIGVLIESFGVGLFIDGGVGQLLRKIIAKKCGISNPGRFSPGKQAALDFVESAGLPIDLAGEPREKKPKLGYIVLNGQITIPELADFQRDIHGQLVNFLQNKEVSYREKALMCLPTGAGKTRCSVEAIHHWIKSLEEGVEPPHRCNLIAWIAQTNELCEQALDVFQKLWTARPHRKGFGLVRLWGQRFEADLPYITSHIKNMSHPVMLITTNQTLHNLTDPNLPKDENREAFCEVFKSHVDLLVIDEAHHAKAKTYLSIIDRIKNHPNRVPDNSECKFLGMTATPFRHDGPEALKKI